MHLDDFHLDDTRLIAAIAAAEQRTSGEIRVVIAREKVPDALPAAEKEFVRLGMTATAARNGILLFIAPRSRTFAILGDSGIHAKCPPDFWTQLARALRAAFQHGEFTTGIVETIARAGDLLAAHFPRSPDDRNELPDQIERP